MTQGPIAALRSACDEPYAAARAARAAGRKVVGYIGHSVPVELIEAAGCFPVLLSGLPSQATGLADRYLDDDFDGATRSLLQQLVSGECDFLDLLIVPRSSNELLHLYYFLLEIARIEPDLRLPRVELFDVLNTPFHSTGVYLQGRVRALATTLANLSGESTKPDAALRVAIAQANVTRRQLQSLNALRRETTPGIAGSTILQAIRAAGAMPRAGHNALLAHLAESAGTSPNAASAASAVPRLMVKGAAHDDATFYLLAEELGAAIVADDTLNGERTFEALIDEVADPVEAIAEHYQLNVPTLRSYPQERQDRRFAELLEQAKVQAVVVIHDEFDDTMGWDWPAQKRLLEQRKLPYVLLDKQSYRTPDRAAQRVVLANLIARIEK